MTSVIPPLTDRQARKDATRERILSAAADLFSERGIERVGVDAVMGAAGLTHGGFYAHFASKEALAAAVCAEELGRSAARWRATAESVADPDEAFSRIVTAYLAPTHARGDGTRGCLLPSLAPELARRPNAAGPAQEAMASMAATLGELRPRLDGMATLATMVGALMLARLCADEGDAGAVLDAAREAILHPPPGLPA